MSVSVVGCIYIYVLFFFEAKMITTIICVWHSYIGNMGPCNTVEAAGPAFALGHPWQKGSLVGPLI